MPGTRRTPAAISHELYPDCDVVAFHYRGYAPSTGSPSAEALIADAPLIHDFAVEHCRPRPDHRRRFQHRQRNCRPALGAAQARRAAPRHAVRFPQGGGADALPVAADRLVVRARHRRGEGARAQPACRRRSSPPQRRRSSCRERTAALSAPGKSLAFDRTIARAGHNDIYARSEFHERCARRWTRLPR